MIRVKMSLSWLDVECWWMLMVYNFYEIKDYNEMNLSMLNCWTELYDCNDMYMMMHEMKVVIVMQISMFVWPYMMSWAWINLIKWMDK